MDESGALDQPDRGQVLGVDIRTDGAPAERFEWVIDREAGSLAAVAAARVLAEDEGREARGRVGAHRRFEEVDVDRRCIEAPPS